MDMLNTHPITVVSERTGLSQDVLRVWERRYGAVQPVRGPGGQRLYTDADIARLRLLLPDRHGSILINEINTETLLGLLHKKEIN